jgi:uncharacterized phage protein (TIGR01671 family)
MKRIIKFRAWDNQLKKYHYDEYWIKIAISNQNKSTFSKDPIFVLEQFTGMFDKKGKEIYEGDIVTNSRGNYNYFVGFETGSFICYHLSMKDVSTGLHLRWGLLSRSFELGEDFQLEIIGNIHENKELI